MVWKNGYINEDELIIFKRGWNAIDGNWFWGLTPATLARHNALVRLGQRNNNGRTLQPSEGWGTYRPYDAQIIARNRYGNGAAVPGTSSHGGFWEGRETLAIDYGNWAYVYNGNRQAFYADVRAVGLAPGMISTERGYPDEPWHVIDLNPKSAVPNFSGLSAEPIIPEIPKESNMRVVRWNKSHVFVFGEEKVTHLDNWQHAIAAAIIHNPEKEFQELDDLGLTVAMITFGVPWSAVDACMQNLAYNISGGSGGRYWSRAIEQKIDTANLAKSLDDLRKTADATPGIKP